MSMGSKAFAFAEAVLRGYGQLFLSNNPISGALFLIGMILVSPTNSCWSLAGACLVTLGAYLGGAKAEAGSGLFGVNGALLGYSWVLFPEVGEPTKAALTIFGSFIIAVMLIPGIRLLRRRRSGITLFAIPYILAVWLNLLVMNQFGLYDSHMLRGWNALASDDPEQAKRSFEAAKMEAPRGVAYRDDGLGWAEYKQGNMVNAKKHFLDAVQAEPTLGDAYTGAGWCCVRLREPDQAKAFFQSALVQDSALADAWEGLGWMHFASGESDLAADCFRRAILLSPLREDAYRGLSSNGIAAFIERNVPRRWQYIPSFQLLSWLLIFIGIAYHSRFSFLLAIGLVVGCVLVGSVSLSFGRTLSDPAMLYNLFPLVLALGGQYLRFNRFTAMWLVVASLLLALFWQSATTLFTHLGLPVLCLPFHVLFITSLLLFRLLQKKGITNSVAPLSLAVTSPEYIRVYIKKSEIANDCWRLLRGKE
jgi:urea transporter